MELIGPALGLLGGLLVGLLLATLYSRRIADWILKRHRAN